MPSNIGSQQISIKYFDPVNNDVANKIGLDVRKTGIYSGGYLTKTNDTTVSLSAFACEIADSGSTGNQVRCATGVVVSIIVSTTTKLVVLRWTYTGNAATDYVDFVAIVPGAQLTNDIIVGTCVFAGSTLTGFNYGDSTTTFRSTPNIHDINLKVEPTVSASMYVRVRAGNVNYGDVNFSIADQLSPLLSAPGSNSWIVAIQVSLAGAIIATYGSSAASPVAPTYGGLVTLAEITIVNGQSSITSTSIVDVRTYIAGLNYAVYAP